MDSNGTLAKWIGGLTAVAIVATIFRSRYASADIAALGKAVGGSYLNAQGIK